MATPPEHLGFFLRSARAARRLGAFYLWTVTGNLQERKDDFRRIKAGLGSLFNRQFRHETFDEAVARLELHETDLDKQANYFAALSFLFGLMTVVSLCFLLATPLSANPLNHTFMSAGTAFIAVTKCLAIRFRVAQIRQRQFFEFKDWLFRR